eukprot:359586-Chlamydomonas_euryale.AAC.12
MKNSWPSVGRGLVQSMPTKITAGMNPQCTMGCGCGMARHMDGVKVGQRPYGPLPANTIASSAPPYLGVCAHHVDDLLNLLADVLALAGHDALRGCGGGLGCPQARRRPMPGA